MSEHAAAVLYLTALAFSLLLAIAGSIAAWISWQRDRRRRAREFLRAYDQAVGYRPVDYELDDRGARQVLEGRQ